MTVHRTARVAFLAAVWLLLWGSISAANVLSGIGVAVLLLLVYPTDRGRPAERREPSGVPWWRRPVAVVRLAGSVVAQLIASNALLTREVLTPGSKIRTAVVACRLRSDNERAITLLANVLALTPGTMPVNVQLHPAVIHVHVLHLDTPVATRRTVARLEALVIRAVGTAAEIDRLGERLHHEGAGLPIVQDTIETGDEASP